MTRIGFPWDADWLALLRIFSDIAYSTDIAIQANILDLEQAPRFEQRYKSVTNLLRQRRTSNVIELAAGFSSRGLFITSDPNITYIETDLADQIKAKELAVTALLAKVGSSRPNLMFAEVNALMGEQISHVASKLTGPVTIVSEGLFSYQTREHQKLIAKNIHSLLSVKGGGWITPDITTQSEWAASYGKEVSELHEGQVHLFDHDTEIEKFFIATGFCAEKFKQAELAGELVSVERLRLDRDLIARRLSNMRIYCLTPL
jgi:O-methyltransferase involved in polyketide biosynthesis